MEINFFFKIIIFFTTLLYPFALYFKSSFTQNILILMFVLWFLNIFISNDKENKIISFFLSFFFFIILVFNQGYMPYFYPVLVNSLMMFVFAISLKKTAIITKIALLKDKNLSSSAIFYTRQLTKAWIIFFIMNATITLILIFLDDKSYWTIYVGFISYILIGLFFCAELIFRYFYKRKFDA